MSRHFKVLTIFLFLFLFNSNSFSAESRATRKVGLQVGINGQPAPSAASFELAWNPFGFMRLQAGVGGYSNAIVNTPRVLHNYIYVPLEWTVIQLVKPIMFGLAWLVDGFDKFVTTGHVRTHLGYQDFWKGGQWGNLQIGYINSRSIFTYGGGVNLFVPQWSISPTAGIHWAHFHSNGDTYGLNGEENSHTYYSGGFDALMENGFNFGMGLNICPGMNKAACGIYGQIGTFF